MMRSENAPSIRRNAPKRAAAVVERLRQKMQNDFAVGGRLENRAFAFQFVAQDVGVDEIAVVRNRHLAADAIDHERLRIFDRAGAGRRITRVTDRAVPLSLSSSSWPKTCDTSPMSLCMRKLVPGPLLVTMPALSWPRCWSAKRP